MQARGGGEVWGGMSTWGRRRLGTRRVLDGLIGRSVDGEDGVRPSGMSPSHPGGTADSHTILTPRRLAMPFGLRTALAPRPSSST